MATYGILVCAGLTAPTDTRWTRSLLRVAARATPAHRAAHARGRQRTGTHHRNRRPGVATARTCFEIRYALVMRSARNTRTCRLVDEDVGQCLWVATSARVAMRSEPPTARMPTIRDRQSTTPSDDSRHRQDRCRGAVDPSMRLTRRGDCHRLRRAGRAEVRGYRPVVDIDGVARCRWH